MLRRLGAAGTTLAVALGLVVVPALSSSAATPPTASDPGPTPLARAVTAADRAADAGLDALAKGPLETYERRTVTPWLKGLYSVAYERTYRGLPVVGGDAVVLADGKGAVRGLQSATRARISVPTRATVRASAAEKSARARLRTVEKVESQRLVVRVEDDRARLAWETVLTGTTATAPSHLTVWTDARTGRTLGQYDDVRAGSGTSEWNGPSPLAIDTTASGGQYSLRDPGRPGLSCADYSTNAVFTKSTDSFGTGNASSKETGCVDVMWAAQKEWDMLGSWLGRNGHNGNGGSWPAKVGLNDVNAYWNGSTVSIGHNNAGKWIAAMDVVGHEYGHGIDQFTPGGANNESGLGEATGDIFGALTEAYADEPAPYDTPGDYLVGEMINLVGQGPIRNMYNPAQLNHPSCYSSAIPSTEVHAAAGPLNHWFYLLAEGSNPGGGKPSSPTCDNSTVTGVGIQTAGKIFYGGMLLKTSGMTHKRYRTTTLTAAKNLDPGCGLFERTKAAWNAVSVPAQSGDPVCTPTPGDDYALTLSPASGSVTAGSSVETTVHTTVTSGGPQSVALSATGAPTGVTVAFSPATVTSGGSARMTVAASSSAAPGTYTLTVKADGATDHTAQYTLTVGGSDPTPGVPDIDVDKVRAHLTQFASIASANGGNRRSTGAGYAASVAYVKGRLQAAGYTVSEQACTSGCTAGAGNNLIAEWPRGDADKVVMFGAHLDGVSAGPGINDNGSGSAALLETALVLAEKDPAMLNRVRFAWWTDEEQGLKGSDFYARSLTAAQRSAVKAYYNFDMVASVNGGYFVNNLNSAASVPMKAYWDSLGLQPQENVEGQGRSDDYSFQKVGIPTSGYATGASARKTAAEAAKWGGTSGGAYDPCYHSACDTTANINATALNRAVDGIAYTVWKTAVGGADPESDFSLAVSPVSGTVAPGASTTATVTTTATGPAQTVGLTATGAPAGVTVAFSPASVTSGGSAGMTVTAASNAVPGSYTLTVTGTGTATHSTTYTLTVQGAGNCSPRQLVANGGFESGTAPWTGSTGSIGAHSGQRAHSGTRFSWLGGYGYTATDTISQTVTVPADCARVTLEYWLHIDTQESGRTAYDLFRVKADGTTLTTLSNADAASGYTARTLDLSAYAGRQVTLTFTATEDAYLQTSFVVDDVTLRTS